MLHSLVIGFTLALASGSDFESLATAISFHQLFEGLSLGIRIAALPAHPDPRHIHPRLAPPAARAPLCAHHARWYPLRPHRV
jgi:zinc transporter 1/2/3